MEYHFLKNNELVLVDYMPGSSGQLFLRIWAELDKKLMYDNPRLLSTTINENLSSREVDYEIVIPKRIVNWFYDKQKPNSVEDYSMFFEMLGTTLLAKSQPWVKGKDTVKFYDPSGYKDTDNRVIYGFHGWSHPIPLSELKDMGLNIRLINIVANTDVGFDYQTKRANNCYPKINVPWEDECRKFNSTTIGENVDFCTMLANNDVAGILTQFEILLGDDLRIEKINRVRNILNEYYLAIVKHVF